MRIAVLCFTLLFIYNVNGQDPLRFKQEIENFKIADDTTEYQDVILFTGSSSIRFWTSLEEDFPEKNVLNRGFGGSEFSDLIYYSDQLIIQYLPKKIFVYEGDNDIASGKSVDNIMKDAGYLISKIRRSLPNTEVHIISPKPSIARKKFKPKYLELNNKLKMWCASNDKLTFVDVWTPMCDKDGEVKRDLFIIDRLHMNAKGYTIWKNTISPFVN